MPTMTRTSRGTLGRLARGLVLAAATVSIAACDSFIDPDPTDILAPENFYKTSSDAIAATNGIYEQAKWGHYISYWYMSDVASDDILASPNFGSDGHRFSNWTFDATEGNLWGVWGDMYQVINRSNAVLDNVPAISMDTTLRRRLLGEAYFMRGLAYLNLVRFWGDVPLLDHQVNDVKTLRIPRAPKAQVWALVESDFAAAAERLPDSYSGSDVGRPTRGAALTLLAKAYLTQEKWTPAAQAAGQVITGGRYALLDNWKDNFRIATEITNSESIFELNFDPILDPGNGSVHTLFSLPSGFPGGDAYGLMQIPPSLEALYAANDERGVGGTFARSGYVIPETGVTATWSMPNGPAPIKYFDATNTQNRTSRAWNQQHNNWIVTRYADVLLMYAEAVAQGGTATAGTALDRLNQVRRRAGLTDANVTGAALIDAIRLERRREFVFEGHRWFDLSRWNQLDAAIRAKTAEARTIYGASETTVHGVPSNYFPIPQGERNVNPALTQNEGWN